MHLIGPLAVIIAALVALSGFIIAKKPELKSTFEKIAPYQGFLGVGLLAYGIWDLITILGHFSAWMKIDKLFAISALAYVGSEIVLGFILGFGLIATWIPGEGGAEKGALKVQKTLLGFSLPIGLVGIASAICFLILYP